MRPKSLLSRSPKKAVWECFHKIGDAPHAGKSESKFSFSSLTGRFLKNVHAHARTPLCVQSPFRTPPGKPYKHVSGIHGGIEWKQGRILYFSFMPAVPPFSAPFCKDLRPFAKEFSCFLAAGVLC